MAQETKYKSSIYNEFKERKYVSRKTQKIENKITTRNILLRKLLKDFRYGEEDCEVYYKELGLCDWEEAITALYMFSPQYIENDGYYDGKLDTIDEVYKLPATTRKAIYDLFQYLSDSEIKPHLNKVIFNYEKFEKEYVEINENNQEFQQYYINILSPLVKTIQKESYELSMIWSGLIVHLTNEETGEILKDCEEITRKYEELSEEVEGICERVTDITLEYKGEEL